MILIFLTHLSSVAIVAFVLGTIFGKITTAVAIVSIVVSIFISYLTYKKCSDVCGLFSKQWTSLEVILAVFIMTIGFRHFLYLFYESENQIKTLLAYNFGDLALHINYIQLMAGGSFPPLNPEFGAEVLRYPFAIDLYSSIWEVLGVRTQAHLFLLGMISLWVAICALRIFSGWLGLSAFFLSGGMQVFYMNLWSSGNFQDSLAWKNLFLTVYITQRGFLFALPCGVFLLWYVLMRLPQARKVQNSELTVVGMIWGVLSFFHLHSFFILSIMIVLFCLIQKLWRSGLFLMMCALPLGTFFVLRSTDYLQKKSVIHFKMGWMIDGLNPILFFLNNYGAWLFLVILTLYLCFKNGHGVVAKVFGIFLTLFIVFNFIMMAPWQWDNIKILIWPFLGFSYVAYQVVDRMLDGMKRYGLAVVLSLTGVSVVAWSASPLRQSVTLYHMKDINEASGVTMTAKKGDVFVSAPNHDHVLTFLGHVRLMGYEGHLWSHGIQYGGLKEDIRKFYLGEIGIQDMLVKYKFNFVFWGPQERLEYKVDAPFWKSELKLVAKHGEYELYSIK